MLTIHTPATISKPLDVVTIAAVGPGAFEVRDGQGMVYHRAASDQDVSLMVGGAIGTHVVFHLDADGAISDQASFRVAVETEIDDGGRFRTLFDQLYDTLFQHWTQGYTKYLRINGKRYKYYVSWLRDHVHALKGMKYFDHDLNTGIELYADTQREDGMIWDKVKEMAHSELQSWRDVTFGAGDFSRRVPGNPTRRFQRIPVENDVEFLFLEGIYYTWKACGDDAWMAGLLDRAIAAVGYATSDPYRWSEQFQLLKRGYTIDTWDFQSRDDAKRSGGEIMVVDPERTAFNVFHGDNTGMAVGCQYLAEMLRVAGREDEATTYAELGRQLKQRLDQTSWNGRFYTHMVPEDPSVERDLGDTPTDEQITLSNAYALNRRIDHEQCLAIIDHYRGLRTVMPPSSAGEWYNCYPPFERGFGGAKWNYMNGGVSTICAGELAHGAFEHGREAYAVDILDRLIDLAERHGGYLHNTFKGAQVEAPPTRFTPVPLRYTANVDIHGETTDGHAKARWTGDGANDMRHLPVGEQVFADIPFTVNEPAAFKRQAVIGIHREAPYHQRQFLPIDDQAQSIYLLHTCAGSGLIGELRIHYLDGVERSEYIQTGRQLDNWFMPAPDLVSGRNTRRGKSYRMGWQGPNGRYENVGMYVWGWNNPRPEERISHLEFRALDTAATWFIAGVTLSDQAVHFADDLISHGIPDMWGAAAVLYALVEGLAGIVDTGVAFSRVRLQPRWSVAGVDAVTAAACYPASGGYLRYRYACSDAAITLSLASAAESVSASLLLPDGATVSGLQIDGQAAAVEIATIETSRYLDLPVVGRGAHTVTIELA